MFFQAGVEGFASIGIADAAADAQRSAHFAHWLDEGHHATMGWMEERRDQRADPQTLWPAAQRVIALGMSYAPGTDPLSLADRQSIGRVSVYAQGRDYHDVVKKALKRLARWLVHEAAARGFADPQVKVFVDTAPVMEKPLGAAAGIGWQGKHSNLVSRTHGSWLFLGAIYTDVPLAPDTPHADRCGSCRRCLDACPTNAFPSPRVVDARRCISYLTIEHKGSIPDEFRKAIGNRIYGCDDCLAVCPWNSFASAAAANRAFLPRAELAAPPLDALLALDDAGFRALFSGSPVKRIGHARFIRNCLIAAGNSRDPALRSSIFTWRDAADPVIAEAAQWALAQLAASADH
ncbi:tRNA epoxyqueuosine(34) reductase QueG [Croceicoccus sp. F390]|uniref:tRNA epoxyqueuosine(34) reductase QueG n=1 Tax=Croceicoccus esteveae TaxID=3075597 RepID=A0ABU2ZKH1_9SPHN|nr:tRNA epoxyqueuosine(34) reductase QueG [Croceicoccus sp. F390]MDT0576871.1 tRNA epoxyqueuosine(34) reductase QueG [Croceicoccus sp. F390]